MFGDQSNKGLCLYIWASTSNHKYSNIRWKWSKNTFYSDIFVKKTSTTSVQLFSERVVSCATKFGGKKPYTTTTEYQHSNERCFYIYFKYSTPQITWNAFQDASVARFFSICIKRTAWTHHIFWQRHTNAITKLWRHKFTCQNNDGNLWRERNVGKNTPKYAKLIHRKWLEVRSIVRCANDTVHFFHFGTKI